MSRDSLIDVEIVKGVALAGTMVWYWQKGVW